MNRLRDRVETGLAERLARSVAATTGAGMRTEDVPGWLAEHRRAGGAQVRRIPFAEMEGWSFRPGTGNLAHRSGRFFAVEGLQIRREREQWRQPILVQPEIGILGIVACELDGVLHVLMQAKMEPGNPGLVQLSPTVQATRSNYSRVHSGAAVRHLELFTEPGRSRTIADVLQSEQGAWFLHKRNRNIVVEVDRPVPAGPDFCWLTLGQLGELLRLDGLVNMDVRTVLGCLPMAHGDPVALSPDADVLAWFTGERARHDVLAHRLPLAEVTGWVRRPADIAHLDGRHFRVVAVAVSGAGREVAAWTQPLLEPVGPGLVGFAVRRFAGMPHLLARARVEAGFLDVAELGPTVQVVAANYAHRPAAAQPRFLDVLQGAPAERIRYSAVHSEEGGRFLEALNRYVIVETDESTTPEQPPAGFRWVTVGQLTSLAAHSRYVNVQARTLLAALHTGAARI